MQRFVTIRRAPAVRITWQAFSGRLHQRATAVRRRRKDERELVRCCVHLLRDIGIDRADLDRGVTREERCDPVHFLGLHARASAQQRHHFRAGL